MAHRGPLLRARGPGDSPHPRRSARSHQRVKRGRRPAARCGWMEDLAAPGDRDLDLLAIDEALQRPQPSFTRARLKLSSCASSAVSA